MSSEILVPTYNSTQTTDVNVVNLATRGRTVAKPCKCSGNLVVFCALLLLSPRRSFGPNRDSPARDPNAVALAGKAPQPLAGLATITDITLEDTATYIANERKEWAALGPKKEISR